MREASQFRFRVWHKTAKKMATVDALLWSTDGYLAHTADGFSGSGHLADSVLMQWTGLHDSQGQDVYEGDVIEITKSYNEKHLGTHQVIYDQERGGYRPFIDRYVYGDFAFSDIADTFVVIGNIWEQPGLMEKKEASDGK